MAPKTDERAAQSAETSGQVDNERRDALRRMARFGAYTAPTLLAMLASAPTASAS
jgi:hypothetical protein